MKIEVCTFPNFGYLLSDLPRDVLHKLALYIDKIDTEQDNEKNYSHRLVATTKQSYDMIDQKDLIEPHVMQMISEYDKNFPGYLYSLDLVSKRTNIGISDLWINFQSAGDINPNHCHPGIFSFVIWMFTPYNYADQQKNNPGAKIKGAFEFSYVQITGQINRISIPVDKSYNGKLCLFPSSLTHCVYPFENEDSKRISISGNVKFLTTY